VNKSSGLFRPTNVLLAFCAFTCRWPVKDLGEQIRRVGAGDRLSASKASARLIHKAEACKSAIQGQQLEFDSGG
jgi:hypothetical protein